MRYFAHLAEKHNVYITVPIAEQDGKKFFSTVVLVDPKGRPVLYYRKRQLSRDWDSTWANPGEEKAKAVDTPYGRIGLVIGYDLPKAYPELVEEKADIILWSSAFRISGENFEKSLNRTVRLHVKKSGINLALANWVWAGAWWEGSGYSRIISSDGSMSLASKNDREMLVVRDIKIAK